MDLFYVFFRLDRVQNRKIDLKTEVLTFQFLNRISILKSSLKKRLPIIKINEKRLVPEILKVFEKFCFSENHTCDYTKRHLKPTGPTTITQVVLKLKNEQGRSHLNKQNNKT